MLIFCVFWLPALSVLWINSEPARNGYARLRFFERVCAFATGAAVGIIRFFAPSWWTARGFGMSRFIEACFDYVMVPAAIPLVCCFIFYEAQKVIYQKKTMPDWTGWTLLSLIPPVLICAARWGTEKNPANLVLVPVLWSALALNVCPVTAFFTKKPCLLRAASCIAGITVFLLLASTVWWLFFASKMFLGFLLLAVVLAPAGLTMIARLLNETKKLIP